MDTPEMQQFKGSWQQLKGRLKEIWGVLSDDELDRFEGKWDQLVGYIQEKTGEAREIIQQKLAAFRNS
ncbi:CsbD family protein [Rhodothermus marinus]|jgi:uncharacterized protein YjbJ (UPF0337 family)|uniref:CsbD family protein n=1 Tax=Rhodothermus marinus TaxID=29549 RepID=UPI000223DDA6|nr:CsbD family protein [Rhodothermus marinus]AEN72744.1 CsbD family protein [Rhodothermus marinus SG0.5JP17-172]BBM70384.1 hypothetical protein RmaAA213_22300 [Rhodothermus marinus]BBM73371.1 hypothetical protein RmaAA338_22360 [Rhodothermus marinus]